MNAAKLSGWLTAGVAVAVAVYFEVQMTTMYKQLTTANTQIAELKRQAETLTQELDKANARANASGSTAGSLSGAEGATAAKMASRMALKMNYGPLFAQLGLSPEDEKKVRDIIAKAGEEHIASTFDAINKGGADHAKEWQQRYVDSVRTELSKILPPEKVEIWAKYEQDKPRNVGRGFLDAEFQRSVPDLAPENRKIAVDSIIDALFVVQDKIQAAEGKLTRDEITSMRLAAYDEAAQQLKGKMGDAELALVQKVIDERKAEQESFGKSLKDSAPTAGGAATQPSEKQP